MAFVCKQTAVLVVRINNIGQEKWCFDRLLALFLTLYLATYFSLADWLYFYSFYSIEKLTHLTTILPFGSLLGDGRGPPQVRGGGDGVPQGPVPANCEDPLFRDDGTGT